MMKKGKFDELLASEVAGGLSIKDAASKVGCSLTHAYHISSSSAFQSRVSAIRSEAVQGAVGRLSVIASRAVDALDQLLGPENDARDRLAASKTILSVLVPMSEFAELRSRLDRLEQPSALKVVS
jgi:hypothetical protein